MHRQARLALLGFLPLIIAGAHAPQALALPPCTQPGSGWCLAHRFAGDIALGEMGFRFGDALDMDGDGRADVAAGTRFKLKDNLFQNGEATVWSGATGAKIREWDGTFDNGLFGHWVLPLGDIDGDRSADLVVSAPTATPKKILHGVVSAWSAKSGAMLWQHIAEREENLGWDLAPAGDQNGDGVTDLFAGAPCNDGGRVYLLSGKDGAVLRTYAPDSMRASFGWYVADADDLDGDAHRDLIVGCLQGIGPPGDPLAEVSLISASTGKLLHRWSNEDAVRGFGEVVASVGDLDGDGRGEIAISSPGTSDQSRSRPGEVQIFSSATGAELRRWQGTQAGELYGRMVYDAGDVDADGVGDVAIGAPWYRAGDADKTGRAELRSGKTGQVLVEWVGEQGDCWFGWHMRRVPDPEGKGQPALLVGSLTQPVDGKRNAGVIDLYLLKR